MNPGGPSTLQCTPITNRCEHRGNLANNKAERTICLENWVCTVVLCNASMKHCNGVVLISTHSRKKKHDDTSFIIFFFFIKICSVARLLVSFFLHCVSHLILVLRCNATIPTSPALYPVKCMMFVSRIICLAL